MIARVPRTAIGVLRPISRVIRAVRPACVSGFAGNVAGLAGVDTVGIERQLQLAEVGGIRLVAPVLPVGRGRVTGSQLAEP